MPEPGRTGDSIPEVDSRASLSSGLDARPGTSCSALDHVEEHFSGGLL